MPYLIASITGFVVGVLNSFLWNNLYVFKKNDNEKRNPWLTLTKTFLAYAGTGLVMANILLILFIEKYGISKYVAPLITLLITVPLNFIINKYWSFRIEKKENGET